MKFLLFLLGVIFFFIFFFFSQTNLWKDSFVWNLFIEGNLYVFFTLFFIFFVFKWQKSISKQIHSYEDREEEDIKIYMTKKDFTLFLKSFFESYIYYIAIGLFYFSLYLFLKSFYSNIQLSFVFLFFNIIVVSLYFIEHKFSLFRDFLRVNTLCISAFYIFQNILYLLWMRGFFDIYDGLNIIFLWVLFFFFITASRAKSYLATLYSYLFLFLFFTLLWVFKFLFGEIRFTGSIFSFFLSLLFFLNTEKIYSYIWVSKWIIRSWGLLFSWVYLLFYFSLFWNETWEMLFLSFLTLTISVFLLLFHKVFENYISLTAALIAIAGAMLSLYNFFVPTLYELRFMYSICFFVSALYLFIPRFIVTNYVFDRYFFHSFSIVVNIIWVICLLLFGEISILKLSILVAGESLYLFGSYYYFRKDMISW